MNGTIFIPNPSVLTIAMVIILVQHYPKPTNQYQGNVTLDLSIAGQFMGQTYLNNLTIKPGDNFTPMTSSINQTAVLSLIASKNSPYTDGLVPFDITGNASVYNGKELPYFTQALAANKLTVKLNITKALNELGITSL